MSLTDTAGAGGQPDLCWAPVLPVTTCVTEVRLCCFPDPLLTHLQARTGGSTSRDRVR